MLISCNLLFLVATLSLVGMMMYRVVEGNFSLTITENICLDLVNVDGGLARDIVVNVTTVDGTATGKASHMMDFLN